jgi:signal transduction histidine kinase
VVKQHGGDLSVESEPGEYSVFRVTLPRRLPAESAQSAPPPEGIARPA